MLKKINSLLCTFLIGTILYTTPIQAACSFVPITQHPVSAEFQLDADCIMNAIATNPEFVIECKLYDVPAYNKVYTNQSLMDLQHHLFERLGYIDVVALNNSIWYGLIDGVPYLYVEPVYLRKLQKTSLSRKSAQKILKKLKISKSTSQVAACKKIARWMVKNYRYDIRTTHDYDIKRMMKRKKMVCHGYASIFYALAKECGVDVHYIITKDHAYNYVIINGKRYDYDVTYACGTKVTKEDGTTWIKVNKKYVHSKKRLHPNDPIVEEY